MGGAEVCLNIRRRLAYAPCFPVDAFSSLQGMGEAKSVITYVGQSAADRCCLACNSTFSGCVKSLPQGSRPTSDCQLKYNNCVNARPDWKTRKNPPPVRGRGPELRGS